MILLDSQHRLIDYLEPFRGTINQASVYPREIVKIALHRNALSVFLVHNHPSGLAEASPADIALTKHLKQALALVDVRLLDHFIVAGSTVLSMSETRLFYANIGKPAGLPFLRWYIPTAAVLTELRKEGFQPFMVTQTRVRNEDRRPDLWMTFNRAQENLTKGGLRDRSAKPGLA